MSWLFRPHKYYMEICIVFMQIYFLKNSEFYNLLYLIEIVFIYDSCMYDLLGEEDK